MEEEYTFLIKNGFFNGNTNIILDNTMLLRIRVYPIIVILDREDYLSFIRILYATITYDDFLDELFYT
jgi:hypothetical protein